MHKVFRRIVNSHADVVLNAASCSTVAQKEKVTSASASLDAFKRCHQSHHPAYGHIIDSAPLQNTQHVQQTIFTTPRSHPKTGTLEFR